MRGTNLIRTGKFAVLSLTVAVIIFSIFYVFNVEFSFTLPLYPSYQDDVIRPSQTLRSAPPKPPVHSKPSLERQPPGVINRDSNVMKPVNNTITQKTITAVKDNTTVLPTTLDSEDINKHRLADIHNVLYKFTAAQESKFFQSVDDETSVADCPPVPPRLVGRIKTYMDNSYTMPVMNSLDWYVKPGGSYAPQYCKQKTSVAIVIPYRNREEHLAVLLLNLHPFLQKQQRDYTIFVVNQLEGSKFNRAILMNIGFWEAMKKRKYDCIIFHDVDLIPENDRNIYNCPDDNPRHMSVAIDKFNYKLTYKNLLGGIVAVRWDIFMAVNGYSNQFFGWGGEDDDFSLRIRHNEYRITRYPNQLAVYKMFKHDRDAGNEANVERFKMLESVDTRESNDGLNTLTYHLKSIEEYPLYTQINVEINQTEVMNAPKHSLSDLPYTSEIWKLPQAPTELEKP